MNKDIRVTKETEEKNGQVEQIIKIIGIEPEIVNGLIDTMLEIAKHGNEPDIELPFDLDDESDEPCLEDMTYEELLEHTVELQDLYDALVSEMGSLKTTVDTLAERLTQANIINRFA